jgi:ketosteroid isomerase-like protein
MKQGWIVALLFAVSVAVFSQEKDLPPAQAELVAAERAFAKLSVARGMRESFLTYFADDGVAFTPHPGRAKDDLNKQPVEKQPLGYTLNWAPIFGDISQAGDLGYNTGPVLIEDRSPAQKPPRHALFFSVWKKQPDGVWRVALDVGVGMPAAVAPLDAPFQAARRASSKPSSVKLSAEAARNELLKIERELMASSAARSVAQSWPKWLSDDARIHRNGVLPITGKEALQGWLKAQTMTYKGEPLNGDVAASGDLGYAYGSCELGGERPLKGYFTRVWKRDAQGQWRVVVDILSPLPPPKP